MREISQLIVRMAQDNPGWGNTRIQGALANLSHRVGRGTVANVLKVNGIEPAPERCKRTTWSTFLKAHWKVLAASDFFSVEVGTPRGLVTHYVLFVISIADRVVHVAGITARPDEAWMLQIGRNLVDERIGALVGKRYFIIDRDTKYSKRFRELVGESGTEVIRLPPLSPNLNAHCGALRSLDKGRVPGEDDLHRAGIPASLDHGVHDAFPRGAESPGTGKPTD
jgi:putative transposase